MAADQDDLIYQFELELGELRRAGRHVLHGESSPHFPATRECPARARAARSAELLEPQVVSPSGSIRAAWRAVVVGSALRGSSELRRAASSSGSTAMEFDGDSLAGSRRSTVGCRGARSRPHDRETRSNQLERRGAVGGIRLLCRCSGLVGGSRTSHLSAGGRHALPGIAVEAEDRPYAASSRSGSDRDGPTRRCLTCAVPVAEEGALPSSLPERIGEGRWERGGARARVV